MLSSALCEIKGFWILVAVLEMHFAALSFIVLLFKLKVSNNRRAYQNNE